MNDEGCNSFISYVNFMNNHIELLRFETMQHTASFCQQVKERETEREQFNEYK